MKLTITNNGTIAVPLVSSEAADALPPGEAFGLDGGSTAVIGEKPNVKEQFTQALDTLTDAAKALLDKWRGRNPQSHADNTVDVTIKNDGENPVRVILGDGVTDFQLAPGTTQDAKAKGYIELRELGLVQEPHNSGTPD